MAARGGGGDRSRSRALIAGAGRRRGRCRSCSRSPSPPSGSRSRTGAGRSRCSRSLAVVLYPFYLAAPVRDARSSGRSRTSSTGVVMLVFMMMAVGLNIVVGYAGLLDLGYVAFYAMGAYTAAWFASLQFAAGPTTCALRRASGSTRRTARPAASTSRSGSCSCSPALITALDRDPDRPADAAPARRLPRDRDARLRRDPAADRAQRRQLLRHRLQPDERPERDHADRLAGLGEPALGRDRRLPAVELPHSAATRTLLGHQIQSTDVFFWTALVLLVITVFCSLRLRDSRLGRAWVAIREDETAAAAMGVPLMRTKTWAYATRRVLRRHRGRVLRELQERHVPRRLLLQHLGLHPLHGHPRRDGERLGRDRRRRVPRRTSTARAWRTPAAGSTRTSTSAAGTRTSTCRCTPRDLRRDHPDRDALPPGGADPVATARDGAPRGRRTTSRSTTSTRAG